LGQPLLNLSGAISLEGAGSQHFHLGHQAVLLCLFTLANQRPFKYLFQPIYKDNLNPFLLGKDFLDP
jgi:hypothetical protein